MVICEMGRISSGLSPLFVVMDYFTKWVENEALENSTEANIVKFFKRNGLARFRVP